MKSHFDETDAVRCLEACLINVLESRGVGGVYSTVLCADGLCSGIMLGCRWCVSSAANWEFFIKQVLLKKKEKHGFDLHLRFQLWVLFPSAIQLFLCSSD